MRTIIAGSRSVKDYSRVCGAIERSGFEITRVVCGGARGVDTLGETWARERGIPVTKYMPNWSQGRDAGIRRNEEMGLNAEALVAIWDGTSRGTKHMIDFAKRRGLQVYVEVV